MTTIGRTTSTPERLTPRQREVLELLRRGYTNEEIARSLGISLDGAKWHVSEIIGRLGVRDRHEAARWRADGEQRPWWTLAWLRDLRWSTAAKAASTTLIVVVVIAVLALIWGVIRSDDGTTALVAAPRTMIVAAGGGAIAVDTETGDVTERFGALKDLSYLISPDGTRAAFPCGDDASAYIGAIDTALCLWEGNGPRVVVASSQLPPGGLLEDENWTGNGAWSSDGTKVAFLVYERAAPGVYSSGDLYYYHLATNTVHFLDKGEFARSRTFLRWSPDNSQISMLETSTVGVRSDVVIVSAATGGRINLSESLASDGGVEQYAWSPDSRSIAFTRNEGRQSLYVADRDGARLKRVGAAWGGDAPVWSPDGAWIAASEVVGDHSHTFIIRRDGTDRRRIDGDLVRSGGPAWSHDSKRIAFAGSPSDAFNDQRVYIANRDGSPPRELAAASGLAFTPLIAWSADGDRIFYTADPGPCQEGCPPGYLFMTNVDGSSAPRKLYEGAASEILGWPSQDRSAPAPTPYNLPPATYNLLP